MNADFNDDGRGRKRKGDRDREFERKRMPPKPTGKLADSLFLSSLAKSPDLPIAIFFSR